MRLKIIILLFIVLLVSACSTNKVLKIENLKVGYSSNLISENDKVEIKNIFNEYELSNVDLFFSWVNDFNKEEDLGCGLKNWDKTENFVYDSAKCYDRYEKNHDISDGNCRITAYALLQDKIKLDTNEDKYGTYLMFDIDVIENNKGYKKINASKLKFINLFDEMDVSGIALDEYKNVFSNKLKTLNFKMEDNKVSLISVVLHDSDFNLLFVGHAGVLLDLGDKYMFVEKIAFEQPYQISIIKSKDELISMISSRLSYFEDNSSKGPYIYENDILLYEYK